MEWKSRGHTSEKALCLGVGKGVFGEVGLTLREDVPAAGLLRGEHGGELLGGDSTLDMYLGKMAILGIWKKLLFLELV